MSWCKNHGIKILTIFVFSTENWKRLKREINYLMRLAKKAIGDNLKEMYQEGIKIKVIGQKERLPQSLQKVIEEAEKLILI
ncbi:MAG: undecaprenyl diphosphate synthase family protein [Patescibacteria group bacterium]|nr:undecaprenyl diphosphate synthase family protein [Patescibacteria group bacterium]